MSISKKLSTVVASSLLLTLVSCGDNNHHSGQKREENAICSEVSCLSTVNWKILLQGRVFPDRSRVDINGTTVLNECVAKQKYMIDRDALPQSLTLDNYLVPKRGGVKIKVLDLGHCDSSTTFIEDNDVNFEVVKHGLGNQIEIHL